MLKLEIKKDDEEFPEYDPNKINIRVYPWHDDYELNNASINVKCTDIINLYLNKQMLIKELIDLLSENFNIPINRLKIMKKS